MASGKRRAPAGCYWREGVLWGRIQKVGGDIRWSLHTSDPAIAIKLREARLKEISDEVHHGIEPKRTFDLVAAEWAPHVTRNVGAKTAVRYACSLKQLEPYLSGKTLDKITVKLINAIVDARMAQGVTNATIKRDLGAVSQVLKFALGRGYVQQNVALVVLPTIKERRDPIVLPEPAHIEMVLARCPPGLAKMALAAWRTGCREAELIPAAESAVDHERKQLTVIGKRNKLRVIDLVAFDGYEVFADREGIGSYPIFPTSKGKAYKSAPVRFHELIADVAKKAKEDGIEFRPFTFHHLRHRHAVDWLKAGRSIYDLQRRLGHTSVKTTEIYLAYLTGEEEKVAKYGVGQ